MLKTIIEKLEIIKIMMWTLMWLNGNIVTINVTLQLLDIYIDIDDKLVLSKLSLPSLESPQLPLITPILLSLDRIHTTANLND